MTAVASPPQPLLPFVVGLVEHAARRHGARMVIEPRYRHSAQLIYPDGRVRNLRGDRFDLNPSLAARTAQLRPLAAWLLTGAGIPVPSGEYFFQRDHVAKDGTTHDRSVAPTYAAKLGYPLYAKTSSHMGRECVRLVGAPEELDPTLDALFRKEPAVYLQARIPGDQVGAILVDGEAHLAYAVEDGAKRLVARDDLSAEVRNAAARALAVLGLRYGSVDFICPPGGANPVLLDVRTMPDLERLAGLEPGGRCAVEGLVEQIVVAMGSKP